MPTFLEGVGNVLDIPGSSVRDMLALENPFDQYLPWNWFTQDNRTTGQELLSQYGMGDDHPWLGFGVDVLTDPLTYVGFGAGSIAKGAKGVGAAGRLKNVPKLAKALYSGTGDDAVRAWRGLTTSERAAQIELLKRQRKAYQAMRAERKAKGLNSFRNQYFTTDQLNAIPIAPSAADVAEAIAKRKDLANNRALRQALGVPNFSRPDTIGRKYGLQVPFNDFRIIDPTDQSRMQALFEPAKAYFPRQGPGGGYWPPPDDVIAGLKERFGSPTSFPNIAGMERGALRDSAYARRAQYAKNNVIRDAMKSAVNDEQMALRAANPKLAGLAPGAVKSSIAGRRAIAEAVAKTPRMERALRFVTNPNVRNIGKGSAYLQLTSMGRESQPSYMESMMPIEAGPMMDMYSDPMAPTPYSFQ